MSRPTSTHWIRSPSWDAFWMFSGLWAPALMGLGYFGVKLWTGISLPPQWRIHGEIEFFYLFLGLGVLHRMSTTYAVLATPILREGIRQEPMRYVYVPAGILLGCLALTQGFAFHSAFSFVSGPRGELWAFFLLAYVMVLWERWHFCMQEFGVLSIYRVRARQLSSRDRRFDRFYAVLLMLVVNMILYARFSGGSERKILLYGTPLASSYSGPFFERAAVVAAVVGTMALLVAVGREARHSQRSLPKLAFYVLLGSHTLVLYFFPRALGLFFLSYILHHWMVAIGLFNRITVNSYRTPSAVAAAGTYLIRVGPFFAGCLLYYLVFGDFDKADNLIPLPETDSFAADGVPARIGIGLVVGLFFAFNFLHYYYDRCLYHFSDPLVRKSVGPLLFGPAPGKG